MYKEESHEKNDHRDGPYPGVYHGGGVNRLVAAGKRKPNRFSPGETEVFKHGIRNEWGYAVPQQDTFICSIQGAASETPRFMWSCISAGLNDAALVPHGIHLSQIGEAQHVGQLRQPLPNQRIAEEHPPESGPLEGLDFPAWNISTFRTWSRSLALSYERS